MLARKLLRERILRDDEPRRCFMDGIDWQHHLDGDADGTKLFPSVAGCKRANPCIDSGGCGVVEVEVRIVRWVEPQDLKFALSVRELAAILKTKRVEEREL